MENVLRYTPEGDLIITPSASGWQYAQHCENGFTLLDGHGSLLLVVGRIYENANASPLGDQVRRIVASVNELSCLSVEQIEDGAFRKMREDRDFLAADVRILEQKIVLAEKRRDELLAALESAKHLLSGVEGMSRNNLLNMAAEEVDAIGKIIAKAGAK